MAMPGALHSAAFRRFFAAFALLAAVVQPATALLHGEAHHRDQSGATALGAPSSPSGSAQVSVASDHASVGASQEASEDHVILHQQRLTTLSWSVMTALPAAAVTLIVPTTIVRSAVIPRAPPAYPIASHDLLPAQPRAPPLG